MYTCMANTFFSTSPPPKNYNLVAFGEVFTWGHGKSCCLGRGEKKNDIFPEPVPGFGSTFEHDLGKATRVRAGSEDVAVFAEQV